MKFILKYIRPAAFLLAIVAFAVPGCRMDLEYPLDAVGLHEHHLTIGATYEGSMSSATKTVLRMGDDDKQHVYWVPGDAISLFYGSGTAGGGGVAFGISNYSRFSARTSASLQNRGYLLCPPPESTLQLSKTHICNVGLFISESCR